MAQVKIYGLKRDLKQIKDNLSKIIHSTIVEVLKFPKDKKYQRFFYFEKDEMIFPEDKSSKYTIIEIMMMSGRTEETKKALIKELFKNINQKLNISVTDLEIVILESPASNWGFRGMTGDEIKLNYKVKV